MATTAPRRIISLDVVRGVAVMGILAINIYAMAMPEGVYFNPRFYGGDSGLDWLAWAFNFLFVDAKMRGLFSMLFGASTLLVIEHAAARDRSPALAHYSRIFWLGLFGLAHFYLIWWGDILFLYAACATLLFFFHRSSTAAICTVAAILLAYYCLIHYATYELLVTKRAAGEFDGVLASYQRYYLGTPESLAENLRVFLGSYGDIVSYRWHEIGLMPFLNLEVALPETLGMMLVGMALYRVGFLAGNWSARAYRITAAVSLLVGLAGLLPLLWWQVRSSYDPLVVMVVTSTLSLPFDLLMSIAWAALVILLLRGRDAGWLAVRIAAAGRMAFTNYLATSLVMTTIFYGYGLGLYGEIGRAGLYLFVFGMWAAMLLWSKPWLDRFHYGPLEWVWRTLSRFSPQPMVKREASI